MDRRAYVVPAAVVPLSAGAAYLWRRRRNGGDAGDAEPAIAPDTPTTEAVDRAFTCECGQELRVSGEGRHVVFWPADATVSDALLEHKCPACERDLVEQLQASSD